MDKLKTILESFIIYAIVFYLFDMLFIHDPVRQAIIKATLGAVGFCTFWFLTKPLFKRLKSKH